MPSVAVLQSNYIPWKGYFDIIHDVDIFVFYDDVQYTKNDWRNRNRIKTHQGPSWLTVPVGQSLDRRICDVTIDGSSWAVKHHKSLLQYYSKAVYFKQFKQFLDHIYLEKSWQTLSELNMYLIKSISREFLGIGTEFKDSRDFEITGKRQDRLIDLLEKVKAGRYVSGPSARNYIEPAVFAQIEIELVFKEYQGYPEYFQFFPPFDHNVSILDLLFHTGPDAPFYIWGWRAEF